MNFKKINIRNALLILSLSAVLCFIMFCILIFAQGSVLLCEDMEIGTVNFDKWHDRFILRPYHGRYISSSLTCLFASILPKISDIHPAVFMQNAASVFKSIFIFIIGFQTAFNGIIKMFVRIVGYIFH